MSKSIKERKRKVNLDSMSPEQQDQVGFEMGKKIGLICDKAAQELTQKVNEITGIYGLEAKIQVVFIDSKTGQVLNP